MEHPKSYFFSAKLDPSVRQPKSPLHSSARRSRADGRVYFSESEAVKNERECRVGGLRGDREIRECRVGGLRGEKEQAQEKEKPTFIRGLFQKFRET